MYMLGVGQRFTPPGVRDGTSRAELETASTLLAAAADAGRAVFSDVAHACVDWSTAQHVLKEASAHRALVSELREAMLAGYRGGADSLAALAQADGELAAAQRIEAPDLDTLQAKALVEATTLVSLALRTRGDMMAAEAEQRSSEAQQEATASAAQVPELTVRATAMQMPGNRLGASLLLDVSLPWLWGGGAERDAAAHHGLAAAEARRLDVERRVRTEVVRAARQLRAVERSLEVLTTRELPAARHLIETERAALSSGNFDMTRWLAAAHALREAHLDEARSHGDLAHALVSLRVAVGAPLPAAPARGESK
jgi:outer membrane protein TolC